MSICGWFGVFVKPISTTTYYNVENGYTASQPVQLCRFNESFPSYTRINYHSVLWWSAPMWCGGDSFNIIRTGLMREVLAAAETGAWQADIYTCITTRAKCFISFIINHWLVRDYEESNLGHWPSVGVTLKRAQQIKSGSSSLFSHSHSHTLTHPYTHWSGACGVCLWWHAIIRNRWLPYANDVLKIHSISMPQTLAENFFRLMCTMPQTTSASSVFSRSYSPFACDNIGL